MYFRELAARKAKYGFTARTGTVDLINICGWIHRTLGDPNNIPKDQGYIEIRNNGGPIVINIYMEDTDMYEHFKRENAKT